MKLSAEQIMQKIDKHIKISSDCCDELLESRKKLVEKENLSKDDKEHLDFIGEQLHDLNVEIRSLCCLKKSIEFAEKFVVCE